ncbi:uncharacterized protein JN550_002784 [Neoarthrinium moseri]|uniref:uncharacterized protein n=1 Tax=Neoarthrinium moseri TaxID=1658444 RepID=UPI001FDE4CC8|nr:uncharacterized protein JN550_002784 [Neoarthrinium moseri]KAI1874205.1 hypothetical protein JN550_002784 [Neoarthrinium moseri]
MVSLQIARQSNARISSLPRGLVALFVGATSGIGQSTLQNFAQHAPSPRIYSVARPQTVASHESQLAALRQSNPTAKLNLIQADASLVSEIDKVVNEIMQKETKLDLLVVSAGFMAFEGRKDTREGLDPSMSTRYYCRQRAVQLLLPLLKNAASPRILSVLAGGLEAELNEKDLDLKNPRNWSFWNASVHAATMHTLSLERVARENPGLSIIHWLPGPVDTAGLRRAAQFGMRPPNQMTEAEAGERGLFCATSDRYGVRAGLVPAPEGVGPANRSGGGIFLLGPLGESTDNEGVLATMRERGIDKVVWDFTQQVFANIAANGSHDASKDEL